MFMKRAREGNMLIEIEREERKRGEHKDIKKKVERTRGEHVHRDRKRREKETET
jgi:hypothetical protein